MAAIETAQHYIPLEGVNGTPAVVGGEVGASNITVNVTSAPVQALQGGEGLNPFLVAAALSAALVVLVIAYMLGMRSELVVRGTAGSATVQTVTRPLYLYPGLKARMRRAYEKAISRALRMGAKVRRGFTPMEAARASAGLLGDKVVRIAELYTEHVYAPGQPPPEAVEEAERLADSEQE
ncbi:MAG: DUF4129 domain-containing protein [Thermoproteota archaeon]